MVEVYDLAQGANSQLGNISTRGFVDANDNAMIGGFIVGGTGTRADIRGFLSGALLGPSLSSSGVQGALQDPTLELHDANGATTATNDNWKTNDQSQQPQESEVRATGLAPSSDLEAVIVAALPPGPGTAIVRGKNDGTGVALIEIYNLQ